MEWLVTITHYLSDNLKYKVCEDHGYYDFKQEHIRLVFRCKYTKNFNLPIFSPSYHKNCYICTRKEESEMLDILLAILFFYAIVKIAPKGAGAGHDFSD